MGAPKNQGFHSFQTLLAIFGPPVSHFGFTGRMKFQAEQRCSHYSVAGGCGVPSGEQVPPMQLGCLKNVFGMMLAGK